MVNRIGRMSCRKCGNTPQAVERCKNASIHRTVSVSPQQPLKPKDRLKLDNGRESQYPIMSIVIRYEATNMSPQKGKIAFVEHSAPSRVINFKVD